MNRIAPYFVYASGGLTAQKEASRDLRSMQAGVYDLDQSRTSLVCRFRHLGLSTHSARFTSMAGTLVLDPADPANSLISVSIDPESIETAFPFDFKDSKQDPSEITFKSKLIYETGHHTGMVVGDLTLLGITKPISLDIVFNGGFFDVPVVWYSITGTVILSQYGMSVVVPYIGDEVSLHITAVFVKNNDRLP